MKHPLMTEKLYEYMLDISLHEHPVQKALREATASMTLAGMQVAPDQAQFLHFLVKLVQAKNILELGTFTGYSALSMALALPEDGRLITCDINSEWTDVAKPYWIEGGVEDKIELRLAPALQTLAKLIDDEYAGHFDVIFIDADKTAYMTYYEYALKLVSPRGVIVIDNIFWDGTVLDESDVSAQKREISRLNQFIKQDKRVDVSLLAIADGLFLIKKR